MDQNTTFTAHGTCSPTSEEQFVPDHLFLHIQAGVLRVYDGHQAFSLQAGDYYLVRKNRLVRYDQGSAGTDCDLTFFCFKEPFLRAFHAKHRLAAKRTQPSETFVLLIQTERITAFM